MVRDRGRPRGGGIGRGILAWLWMSDSSGHGIFQAGWMPGRQRERGAWAQGSGSQAVHAASLHGYCSSQVLSLQLDFKCLKAMETAVLGSDGGKGQNLSGTKESPPRAPCPNIICHHAFIPSWPLIPWGVSGEVKDLLGRCLLEIDD